MALGTLTNIAGAASQGPVFHDVVSLAGDAAYVAGGTTGLKAQLRTLRGDNREPLYVVGQDCAGYVVVYDFAQDKLLMYEQDGVGALAEVAAGDYHLTTLVLAVVSA